MTAISSVSKPPLVVAHRVLANIRAHGIVSADDHVDQVELACWKNDPISQYHRFGQRYIRYLRHHIQMDRIDAAVRQISREATSKFSPEAFDIAVTRLKIANCGPLSMLAAIEASKECTVLVVSFIKDTDSHRFLILDPTIDPNKLRMLPNSTLAEVFAKCPNGVVLDPFFKEARPVSEASQMRLVKYMHIRGLKHAIKPKVIPQGFSAVRLIVEEAEAVYQRLCQKDLNAFPSETLEKLNRLLREYICPHLDVALQQWFPNTLWKGTVNDETLSLFMDGTDETTKPVSDQLKAIGVSVKRQRDKKTQSRYQVVLTDPHAAQVCVAANISEVFATCKPAFELILRYYDSDFFCF